jgi:hypothetical protein
LLFEEGLYFSVQDYHTTILLAEDMIATEMRAFSNCGVDSLEQFTGCGSMDGSHDYTLGWDRRMYWYRAYTSFLGNRYWVVAVD